MDSNAKYEQARTASVQYAKPFDVTLSKLLKAMETPFDKHVLGMFFVH